MHHAHRIPLPPMLLVPRGSVLRHLQRPAQICRRTRADTRAPTSGSPILSCPPCLALPDIVFGRASRRVVYLATVCHGGLHHASLELMRAWHGILFALSAKGMNACSSGISSQNLNSGVRLLSEQLLMKGTFGYGMRRGSVDRTQYLHDPFDDLGHVSHVEQVVRLDGSG